ncbi:MAG TPA: VWA domain-containing protein, partial [Porticoccaceae bacterium]|nr:VWA domain-containing protein [Porticoccaceae bacterium]
FLGDGDRQYLTGLKLGGQRALILVDGSASMLAETIVNVVRRRNMDDTVKRNAEKWRRAIRTVEWLAAQLPRQGSYQIYTFNTETRAVLPGTEGRWLDVSDSAGLDRVVRGLQAFVPGSPSIG